MLLLIPTLFATTPNDMATAMAVPTADLSSATLQADARGYCVLSNLEEADSATPVFQGDTPGLYTLDMVVTDPDGLSSDNPAGVVVEVVPWENLLITLNWDTAAIDLDLHLLAPDGTYYGEGDCYYGNPTPDWGIPRLEEDNPCYRLDSESNTQAEVIRLPRPTEGVCTLLVHDYNNLGATDPSTKATLRIFAQQEEIATFISPHLSETGTVWVAGTLDWRNLSTVASGTLQRHEDLGGPIVNEKP